MITFGAGAGPRASWGPSHVIRAVVTGCCALILVAAIAPGAMAAPGRPSAPQASAPSSVGTGGVAINGSASATADAAVTLTIPAPVGSASMLRISLDGGLDGVEVPWTTSLPWSLIDPSSGGVDVDGLKTVYVDGGDGLGNWTLIGTASILLDRTGPVLGWVSLDFPGGPHGTYLVNATDAGVGVARTEISLDGAHWRASDPVPWDFWVDGAFDVREGMIGGAWQLGPATLHSRLVDKLGNVTVLPDQPLNVTGLHTQDDPPVDFSFPLPAITGHDYTIAPVFNQSYRVPAGRLCRWKLTWGDENVRLLAGYDATYGMTDFTVSPVNGMCQPWTFTLPYTPVLEYSWTLAIVEPDGSWSRWTEPFVGAFRATQDSTYRGIADSNLPLYTVVPDRDFVGLDGTVTYRLYARGGAPARSAWWSCGPADGTPPNIGDQQKGGAVFTCHVTTAEAWVAYWSYWSSDERWIFRAGYDPVGDRSRPVMRSLRATVAPGTTPTTTVEVAKLTWAATDSGTGVRRYTVQVQRNGGAWATLTLATASTTTLTRSLAIGSTYRFRARGTDKAGNVGAWIYTPTIRPTRYDDRSTILKWSAGWTVEGGLHTTSAALRTATATFTGQAVGLLSPRGPGFGWAQIFVDGVLVSTINLNAAVAQAPAVVWQRSFGVVGTHSIRVRTLGTVGHPTMSIDGLAVLR